MHHFAKSSPNTHCDLQPRTTPRRNPIRMCLLPPCDYSCATSTTMHWSSRLDRWASNERAARSRRPRIDTHFGHHQASARLVVGWCVRLRSSAPWTTSSRLAWLKIEDRQRLGTCRRESCQTPSTLRVMANRLNMRVPFRRHSLLLLSAAGAAAPPHRSRRRTRSCGRTGARSSGCLAIPG